MGGDPAKLQAWLGTSVSRSKPLKMTEDRTSVCLKGFHAIAMQSPRRWLSRLPGRVASAGRCHSSSLSARICAAVHRLYTSPPTLRDHVHEAHLSGGAVNPNAQRCAPYLPPYRCCSTTTTGYVPHRGPLLRNVRSRDAAVLGRQLGRVRLDEGKQLIHFDRFVVV